jgi:hypothetical protein
VVLLKRDPGQNREGIDDVLGSDLSELGQPASIPSNPRPHSNCDEQGGGNSVEPLQSTDVRHDAWAVDGPAAGR